MKRLFTIMIMSLLILLAACQPQTETPLDLPTPIVDPTEGTTDAAPPTATQPPATDLPLAPTIAQATSEQGTSPTSAATATTPADPTATLPIEIVPTPGTKPGATPAIVLPPPIHAPSEESAGGGVQVAFVESGDTLNVRSAPGAGAPVVGELPPDASGLIMDEAGQSLVAGSTWVQIESANMSGYVNSRFLTETVLPPEYCEGTALLDVLEGLQLAIAERNGAQLAALVHPERGLRLRHSWWNEEILVPGDEVAGLFNDDTVYDWGTQDGSGFPITGTFDEVLLPLLDRDLIAYTASRCAELLAGPTAGLVVLPEGYEPVPFASFYRASADVEFDWGTWVVGVERWDGRYYLSYLVHYAYEI